MTDDNDRFYLCVTCGELKHEDLYEREGDCTCDDCESEGRSAVHWREAPDGEGFVRARYAGDRQQDGAEVDR